MQIRSPRRRVLLARAAALGCAAFAPRALSDHVAAAPADWCGPPEGARLLVPGEDGWLGRLAPDESLIALATAAGATPDTPWPEAFAVRHRGRSYRNPTLAFESGQRARLVLANTLHEPTIVHWHGIAVDTANDGAGMTLVPPAGRYAYDFAVRARSGLYWYHPHPHGLTAGQTYRGLFGLIAVDDADDRALRAALDLVWGRTDIPLVLQDRRPGAAYAPDAGDMHHGFLGDIATVNGCSSAHLDVATRAYRFRILNASNARTYRLGFADAAGRPFPFTLLGTDGGLLAAPVALRRMLSLAGGADRRAARPHRYAPRRGDRARIARIRSDAFRGSARRRSARGDARAFARARRRAHGATARHGRCRALARGRAAAAPDTAGCASASPDARRFPLPCRRSPEARAEPAARERAFRLGFAKGRWRINDRVFAMDETPIEVPRDASEVWLLRNYHTSMPHAMHLHGFQFRVLERETSPDQLAPLVVDAKGRLATDLGWKDTVLVWPGESVRIAIDFRHPFPGAQTWMFHCHNLEHEDGGMMLRMKVG